MPVRAGHTRGRAEAGPASRGRVAIAGAGPAGLSAAIALHRCGFDVRVFERHNPIKPLGGPIILNPIPMHVLRSYGVDVDDLATAREVYFRRHDGRVRVLFSPDDDLVRRAGFPGWAAGVTRTELYERMLACVPDGAIVPGRPLVRFVDGTDGITLVFDDGTSYQADLLLGADGIDSVVRQQLWGRSESADLGIAVWLGVAELRALPRTELNLRHSDRYQFGFAPLHYQGRDRFQWWLVEPHAKDQQMPSDPVQYAKAKLKDFAFPAQDLVDATDRDEGVHHWVVKYRAPLKTWTRGRPPWQPW